MLLREDGIVFFRMRRRGFIKSTIWFSVVGKWVFSCVALLTDKRSRFFLKQSRHENTQHSKFMVWSQLGRGMFAMLHFMLFCLRHT